jgi:hypothetical protein
LIRQILSRLHTRMQFRTSSELCTLVCLFFVFLLFFVCLLACFRLSSHMDINAFAHAHAVPYFKRVMCTLVIFSLLFFCLLD